MGLRFRKSFKTPLGSITFSQSLLGGRRGRAASKSAKQSTMTAGCGGWIVLLLLCGGVGTCLNNDRSPEQSSPAVAVTPRPQSIAEARPAREGISGQPRKPDPPKSVASDESNRPSTATRPAPKRQPKGPIPLAFRSWSDDTGRHQVEAAFLRVEGNDVVLQRRDTGAFLRVPIARLAAADQSWVEAAAREQRPIIIATVVRIADGDTLTVRAGNEEFLRIRLEGIDCPEAGQDHTDDAKRALISKVFKKIVQLEVKESDKYGRLVASVFLEDRWINKELIEEGWAWHYTDYSDDEELAEAQYDAQQSGIGLWADANALAPWLYRSRPDLARGSQEPETSPATVDRPPPARPPPSSDQITVYVTRTGTKYHRSSCRYLRKSRIPMSLQQARAGYGRCSVCSPP